MDIATSVTPRKLAVRACIGASAHLVQSRRLLASSMHVGHPTLVLILAGRKTVFADGDRWVAHAGELVLLPAGMLCDVCNDPEPDVAYEAIALFFDAALVREANRAAPSCAPIARATHGAPVSAGLREAILRTHRLLHDDTAPLPITRHAALEVLTWLAVGNRSFGPEMAPSFVDRLRGLLADTPRDAWTATRAAEALHVSVATLRRRLAREQWTMETLLREVRLAHALTLLQANTDQVGRIALDAGFSNHAHFSRLFRLRFGMTPNQLRGKQAAPIARTRTIVARQGTAEPLLAP